MSSLTRREVHVPTAGSDVEDGASLLDSAEGGAKKSCIQLRGIGLGFMLGILFAGCVMFFQHAPQGEEVNYADLVSQVQNKAAKTAAKGGGGWPLWVAPILADARLEHQHQ